MKNLKLDRGVKLTLILLLVYTFIILTVFLPMYLKKQRETVYIMTNRYKIKYEKRKWRKITNSDDYKLREFNIYQNNEYFGKYKVLFSNHFTLIDDNDEIVKYNGYIFATSGNIKTTLYDYDLNDNYDSSDEEIIKKALDMIRITNDAYFEINQKVTLDHNNDKITFYYVDNVRKPDDDSLDGVTGHVANTSGKNFSVLIMVKNDRIYIVDKIITEENDFKTFEVLNIVDIRDDNKLELIYALGNRYNNNSDCVKLYNIENAKEIKDFCK